MANKKPFTANATGTNSFKQMASEAMVRFICMLQVVSYDSVQRYKHAQHKIMLKHTYLRHIYRFNNVALLVLAYSINKEGYASLGYRTHSP